MRTPHELPHPQYKRGWWSVVWRLAIGLLLVVHGLITGAIWVPPQRSADVAGFGWQASWLFAGVRPVVVTVALVAAGGFVIAGVGYLGHQGWWAPLAIVAAFASFALIIATITPWWSAAVAINAAIIYFAWGVTTAQFFNS